MSDTLLTLVIVGFVGIIAYSKRCEWFQICGNTIIPSTTTSNTPVPKSNLPSGSCLGPANFGDEGSDLGFGFSKDGGPILATGLSKTGEPRVGDNSNKDSLTTCQLPGVCETQLYRGKIQYRNAGLSASADTCDHAKQYYLYKYGLGGGSSNNNPIHISSIKHRRSKVTKKKSHSHYTRRISYF